MWPALLLFGKDHFVAIIVTIAALCLMGYIGALKISNTHLRKKVGELELEIATLHQKEQTLADANQALSDKYAALEGKYSGEISKNTKLLKERLANEKELSAIKLSINAVGLFNASKGNSNGADVASTNKGNDARAAALEKTLADLYAVVYENDANHLICIDTVKKWQNFWKDYEATIKLINNGNRK